MANSKVKRLAALAQKAKARREEQCFVVEGIRMFREAPADWLREVYVSETFLHKYGREALGRVSFEILTDAVFQKASDTQTPQGIPGSYTHLTLPPKRIVPLTVDAEPLWRRWRASAFGW